MHARADPGVSRVSAYQTGYLPEWDVLTVWRHGHLRTYRNEVRVPARQSESQNGMFYLKLPLSASIPSEAKIASNASVNFPSRSRISRVNRQRACSRSQADSRASWLTHVAVGCCVIPRMCTCRLSSSMMKRRRDGLSSRRSRRGRSRRPGWCGRGRGGMRARRRRGLAVVGCGTSARSCGCWMRRCGGRVGATRPGCAPRPRSGSLGPGAG